MSSQIQRRREAAAFLATFTGAQGELIVDTTNNLVQTHDGATPGGWPGARKLDVLPGFRNLIRNGNFNVNQRVVSGTVTLAAGAYGHDGVKGGASGCTYTFAASGIDTVLTITAGSLILPVEASLVAGGVYALSQSGTAQARVWQGTGYTGTGSYAACAYAVAPVAAFQTAALTANTQTNVEFSTGTVSCVQLEQGTVATAFERRPPVIELTLCMRYYQQYGGNSASEYFASGIASGGFVACFIACRVRMRASPTLAVLNIGDIAIYNGSTNTIPTGLAFATTSPDSFGIGLSASGLTAGVCSLITAIYNASGVFQLSAEI